jgi:large subunit ribosomal protein L17
MRHGKKINHLGRTASHRRAMLANMASSLIKHKRIVTTVAKAKSLRVYVEPLITKSKNPSTHNYRTVFSYLGDKVAVNELFSVVSEKVANRPGGYTRILKTGNRMGDNAEMAMIELVDFNEFFDGFKQDRKKSTTRRSRRGTSTTVAGAPKAVAPKEEIQDAVIVEDVVETTPEVTNDNAAPETSTEVSTEETTKE